MNLEQIQDSQRLEKIKNHLDLIFIALASLSNLDSDNLIQVVNALNINLAIIERVGLEKINIIGQSSEKANKLTEEDLRSLALIICYLARQNQELIRRAVNLLENMTEQNKSPHQSTLLRVYLDNFSHKYQQMLTTEAVSRDKSEQLGFKLLIDLLFYSANNGYDRLWLSFKADN